MRSRGIDVSKYDQSFDPDKATETIDFVIQRASYGLVKDELFDLINTGVQKVGARLAYHYLRSDYDTNAQVARFLDTTNGKNFHAYVCDFEQYYNTMDVAFAKKAWDFVKAVVLTTGKRCLIYTNYYGYKDYLVPSEKAYGINWNLADFWIANYPSVPDPEGTPPNPPGRTAGWSFWQYSSKGNGALYGLGRTTAADLDVFNGDKAMLYSWLGIQSTPTPEPTPENPTATFALNVGGVTYQATDVELKPKA